MGFFPKKRMHAVNILFSIKFLKVDRKYPSDFSLEDESHRNSLKLTSWNQPFSDPEIEDLFTDSHSQVN